MQTIRRKQLTCTGRSSSFETSEGVWVYWRCGGADDVSRVRDLSVTGLFLATETARQVGAKAKIEFLVEEGQIRTEAVVRRSEASSGLGCQFIAINDEDRSRLAALLGRLRSSRAISPKKYTAEPTSEVRI
ncbi:MAG: PilZ domain-containing protein [Candidatus Acidiferrum sp.]